MKKYVVALISFFDNEIRQFKIEAESDYEAVKKAMVEFCDSEDGVKDQINWQNDPLFPVNLERLKLDVVNAEMDFCVTEVKEF